MLDIAGRKVTDKPSTTAAVKLCEAMVAGTSFTDARSALDVGLDEDGNAKVAAWASPPTVPISRSRWRPADTGFRCAELSVD